MMVPPIIIFDLAPTSNKENKDENSTQHCKFYIDAIEENDKAAEQVNRPGDLLPMSVINNAARTKRAAAITAATWLRPPDKGLSEQRRSSLISLGNGDHIIRCRTFTADLSMMILCVVLVIVQFAVFDFYFVKHAYHGRGDEFVDDDMNLECSNATSFHEEGDLSLEYIYYFIVPDIIAVAAMAEKPVFQIMKRLRGTAEEQCRNALANVRFACVSWLVYAIVFDAKIFLSASTFLIGLQRYELCDGEKAFLGINSFLFLLCGAALIFLTLVISHHAHTREANDILHSISEIVTFDVLDGVHFLAIIFDREAIEYFASNPKLETAIIVLACINFLLPTLSLMKVFHRLARNEEGKRRTTLRQLVAEECNAATNLAFVNLPYLLVRCYLWYEIHLDVSIFLLKNAIMVIIELRQIRMFSRRIYKHLSSHVVSAM